MAADDITIRMRRDKVGLAGEVRSLDGWFQTLRGHVASTDYGHQEIEGDGSVGTTFKTHRPLPAPRRRLG